MKRLFFALSLLSALAACGQKGPLYLPESGLAVSPVAGVSVDGGRL